MNSGEILCRNTSYYKGKIRVSRFRVFEALNFRNFRFERVEPAQISASVLRTPRRMAYVFDNECPTQRVSDTK